MMKKIRSKFVGMMALLMGVMLCGGSSLLMGMQPLIVVTVPGPGGNNVLATTANLTTYLQGLGQNQLNLDIARLMVWDIQNRPFITAQLLPILNALMNEQANMNQAGIMQIGFPVNRIRVPIVGIHGVGGVFLIVHGGQVIVLPYPAPPQRNPPPRPVPPGNGGNGGGENVDINQEDEDDEEQPLPIPNPDPPN
jgi:hypothetical protein